MKLFTAAVVVALAVTAPVPAHADGQTFFGGCHIATLNDTTPDQTLGGPDTWQGIVYVDVVAKDHGPISALCGLRINGVDQGPVLTAPERPVATFAVDTLRYTAAITDTVALYTSVTTSSGTETCEFPCGDSDQICPSIVCGERGLLDQVVAVLNAVNEQLKVLDPPICARLVAAAPTVDALPTAGVLYIDPDTGDTYVGGTTPSDLFWDCPPYVTP